MGNLRHTIFCLMYTFGLRQGSGTALKATAVGRSSALQMAQIYAGLPWKGAVPYCANVLCIGQ